MLFLIQKTENKQYQAALESFMMENKPYQKEIFKTHSLNKGGTVSESYAYQKLL